MVTRFPRPALLLVLATVVAAVLAVVLAGCGGGATTSGESSSGEGSSGEQAAGEGSSGEPAAGVDGLVWGEGETGVVLAHGAAFDAASWQAQATVLAEAGLTVLAVEDISPEGIEAGIEELNERGVDDVALAGGSAGADSILDLASRRPGLASQLVLLSPNATVEGLGEEPKLFIASRDESVAGVSTELASSAPGDDNQVELVPGSAHAQHLFDTDQGDRVLALMVERLAPA